MLQDLGSKILSMGTLGMKSFNMEDQYTKKVCVCTSAEM